MADEREVFIPIPPGHGHVLPLVADAMPWLQHGAKLRATDVERAVTEAEARGFKRAVEALRDGQAFWQWYQRQPGAAPADRKRCADYLESLIAEVQP